MASVLTGEPGFMQSPDPATLRIAALPAPDDPAAPAFVAGAEIGLLGLDFTTRRRNRANGRLVAVDDGLTVAHRPELRQLRAVHPDAHSPRRALPPARRSSVSTVSTRRRAP